MGRCLYNGIELPAKPNQTANLFEFSWIRKTITGAYHLFLQNEIKYVLSNGNECIEVSPETSKQYSCQASDTEWTDVPITETKNVATGTWVKWADFNMFSTTGELIMAASDPVPVSPVQINPALLVQSFFTGQALRRNRT